MHEAAYPPLLRDVGRPAARALPARSTPTTWTLLAGERPVAIVGSRRGSAVRARGRAVAGPRAGGMRGAGGQRHGARHRLRRARGRARGGRPDRRRDAAAEPTCAYPRSQAQPAHAASPARGLVVSELPPGRHPFRLSFPARNRIMAGLAAMTVVVEGATGSGSLITADFASDLGREVGAVPGQVTSPLAAGPNCSCSRTGACVVRDAPGCAGCSLRAGPAAAAGARAAGGRADQLRALLASRRARDGIAGRARPGPARGRRRPRRPHRAGAAGPVRRDAGGRYVRARRLPSPARRILMADVA